MDLFHCFHCNKSLLESRNDAVDKEYFFWCDKKCYEAYERKLVEHNRVHQEWSDFMCHEGPCPSEMLGHASKVYSPEKTYNPSQGVKSTAKQNLGELPKNNPKKKSGRSCSVCGQVGHNARTCPKSKDGSKQFQKATRKRAKNKRYKCGKCGQLGHNARTCTKG